jgi:hypothetical protein
VELNLAAGTPQLVATKAAYDFILAQTFRANSFPASVYSVTEEEFLMTLRFSWDSLPHGYLHRVVAFAAQHPDKLREWDEHPEPVNRNSQTSVDRNSSLIRARALAHVLARKPYGKALLKDVKESWDPRLNLIFMIMIASDENRGELKTLLETFDNKELVDLFKPIAQ